MRLYTCGMHACLHVTMRLVESTPGGGSRVGGGLV
jgi:hypothetical protein